MTIPVVLFVILYKVVLTFESVGEMLWRTIPPKPHDSTLSMFWFFFISILQIKIAI